MPSRQLHRGGGGGPGGQSETVRRELARRSGHDDLPGISRPWTANELTRMLGILSVAAVALGISWYGVSGTTVWSTQILWTAIGIGAIIVAGMAIMLWLLAGFRAVRIRQSAIADSLASRLVLPEPAAMPAGSHESGFVTVYGMSRFHRPTCQLVADKDSYPAAAVGDLAPCGMCLPLAVAG